jgi:hypothetical protein
VNGFGLDSCGSNYGPGTNFVNRREISSVSEQVSLSQD